MVETRFVAEAPDYNSNKINKGRNIWNLKHKYEICLCLSPLCLSLYLSVPVYDRYIKFQYIKISANLFWCEWIIVAFKQALF